MPAPTSTQELIDLAKKSRGRGGKKKRLEAVLAKLARQQTRFPRSRASLAGILSATE